MSNEAELERARILQMIDDGLISVDEGIALIKALESRMPVALELESDLGGASTVLIESQEETPQSAQQVFTEEPSPESPSQEFEYAEDTTHQPEELPQSKSEKPDFTKWRSFWWLPMWVGVGITVVSAGLMYFAWRENGMGFWFACTWFPFSLGILVMALAWASRTARWLHVRIHQKPGEGPRNIAISLPLPLRLTAWFVRTFRGRIPGFEYSGLDELILALQRTDPDTPFYVEVNEDDDGERVEVYIG